MNRTPSREAVRDLSQEELALLRQAILTRPDKNNATGGESES